MRQEDNIKKEIIELLARVRDAGQEPTLTHAQKKQMLSEILPSKSIFVRFAPLATAMAVFGMALVGYSILSVSRPGTTLYDVKRTVEDTRSIVQPSFDQELLKRRDAEIKTFTAKGDEKAVRKVTEEKKVIEERIDNRNKTSTTQNTTTSPSTGAPLLQSPQLTSGKDDDGEESHSGGSDSSGTSTPTTTSSSTTTQTRDSCREELDKKKQAGQIVTSSQYKTCDQYPH